MEYYTIWIIFFLMKNVNFDYGRPKPLQWVGGIFSLGKVTKQLWLPNSTKSFEICDKTWSVLICLCIWILSLEIEVLQIWQITKLQSILEFYVRDYYNCKQITDAFADLEADIVNICSAWSIVFSSASSNNVHSITSS